MKILHITANLNSHNYKHDHIEQITDNEYSFVSLNDSNYKRRFNSLHPRLQAKIPKMLAFEMYPDYDYYLWTDANITLKENNSLDMLLELATSKDFVLFNHHSREYLYEEFDFMFSNSNNPYILSRYENESIEEQYNVYCKVENFNFIPLYALGCFVYRNSDYIRSIMREWFYHNARYSIQDQLSFPYICNDKYLNIVTLDNIVENKFVKYWGY